MTIILLEALAALALFVGAIWWTMFSGRNKGELRRREEDSEAAANEGATVQADQAPKKQEGTDSDAT